MKISYLTCIYDLKLYLQEVLSEVKAHRKQSINHQVNDVVLREDIRNPNISLSRVDIVEIVHLIVLFAI